MTSDPVRKGSLYGPVVFPRDPQRLAAGGTIEAGLRTDCLWRRPLQSSKQALSSTKAVQIDSAIWVEPDPTTLLLEQVNYAWGFCCLQKVGPRSISIHVRFS